MSLFESLSINDWRQFGRVEIDLTNQTTVLTGSNGCGKTTLLTILSHHFGWKLPFVSTPFIGKKRSRRLWSDIFDNWVRDGDDDEMDGGLVGIGRIRYTDGAICRLLTKRYVESNYQLTYENLQEVSGLYIPSHRPVATYNAVETIPTNPVTTQKHYQDYQSLLFRAFGASPRQNPGVIQKQSIISLALFGEGNSAVAANSEYRQVFEELQEKLRLVLPKEIGFQHLEIRMPEVVLVTSSGDFALDAMSGGINSLFGIVWQVYMSGVGETQKVVVIDEPENHLHPSMQRVVLPNLAKAFPTTRFIVATHSPFIVSSFPEAAVYGLFANSSKRIDSTALAARDLAGTPNKVLREVLNVDSNLPIWVEQKVKGVLEEFEGASPEDKARLVMKALADLGISDAISEYGSRKPQ